MSSKNPLSYLVHARQTKPDPEEVTPETPPVPRPEAPSSPTHATRPARAAVAKRARVPVTTALSPDVRDAMHLELLKQRQDGGKRQGPADLIEDLLIEWLRKRGVSIKT